MVPTRSDTVDARLARVRDDVLTRRDRHDAAVKELHALLAVDPDLAEAHLLLGLVHAGRGTAEMRAEAAAEFRQALAADPTLLPARYYLARTYMELGLLERAAEESRLLVEAAPRSAQFIATLADVERRRGRPADAETLCRRALDLEPGFVEARYTLGLALFDLERPTDAIREIEQAVRAGLDVAEAHVSLGRIYLAVGRADAAIPQLTLGVAKGPAQPEALLALARAYRIERRLPEANAALDRVLPPGAVMEASARFDALESDILIERGLIRLAEKRPADARRLLEQARADRPGSVDVHRALAQAYRALGRESDARASDREAERLAGQP